MIDFSNCKINIGLEIVSKRDDGYHNIESVFYPIPLFDIIELVPNTNGFELFQSGIIVDGDVENNLVHKAWKLLNDKYDFGGVKIHLHKQTPMGAGLGGGSANAAKVLQMINKEFALNIDDEELKLFASKIGSDCPFFIYNKPAYVYNTGTEFIPSKLDLSGYTLVLIKPEVSISTQEAYAGIKPEKSKVNLKDININTLSNWKDNIVNKFENQLFIKNKELKEIKDFLYNQGAIFASMSGSGSSIYGIFTEEINTSEIEEKYFVWKGVLGG
jgi:4-diphosphocytidyl-2-C-methyl-D-erythritol kinase